MIVTHDRTLTHISQLGTITKITPNMGVNWEALAAHLLALKKQGHAVAADEVYTSEKVSISFTVIHYRTCRRCAADAKA